MTSPDAAWNAEGPRSSGGDTEHGPDVTEQDQGRDIDHWKMPLDEFKLNIDRVDNYAEQLLRRPCLEDAGFSWPVPWQDIDELMTARGTWNESGRRIFTVEIAEKWGYHFSGGGETKSEELWAGFAEEVKSIEKTPGFEEASATCAERIRSEHPIVDPMEMFFVTGLVEQAIEDAKASPEVVEAADRWKECMEPLGLGTLPEGPDEMPTEDLAIDLGLAQSVGDKDHGGDTGPMQQAPSARETEVAVADANCSDESGYTSTKYDVEWKLQEQLVEENRTKLDRIRDSVEARRADVMEIIAENAPEPLD